VIGLHHLAYVHDKSTDTFIASVLADGDDLTGVGMWLPADHCTFAT
jgi:hypothetical protein